MDRQPRQANAAFLSANLEGVTPPPVADGAVHVYHQYTVRVPQRPRRFRKALREEYNVGSGMFYPVPNHRLKPFQVRRRPAGDRPRPRPSACRCPCTRR